MPTATQSTPVREKEVVVSGKDARPAKVRSTDPSDFVVPTGREEEWRFTPLRRLHGLHDSLEPSGTWSVVANDVAGIDVTEFEGTNGPLPRFVPSDRIAARALAQRERTIFVDIAPEVEADAAVRVRIETRGVAFGHIIVNAGHHSKASVTLEFAGDARAAINVESIVGDGAHLSVVQLHEQDRTAVHNGEEQAYVGRDATYLGGVVLLGGDLVRVLPRVEYDAPGGSARLLGALLAGPGQHHETRTYIDHSEPHCSSDVAYKAVLQGEGAHTVWIGDVYVRHTATDIDTYELNRNLLLDDGPRADSVPNLELETGNVQRAGHASVTGKLDADQVFYLQSRGISAADARRLVVRGFFTDIMERIGVAELTERVTLAVEAALEGEAHA